MQFAAHWPQRSGRRGILVIRNNLGVRGEGPLYVSAFWELAKSWTFCARPRQAFATPTLKGKKTVRKYTGGNAGPLKGYAEVGRLIHFRFRNSDT